MWPFSVHLIAPTNPRPGRTYYKYHILEQLPATTVAILADGVGLMPRKSEERDAACDSAVQGSGRAQGFLEMQGPGVCDIEM